MYSFSILVNTSARSFECTVQQVMVKCVSTCLPASLSPCHVFSQCCVISLQLRQVLLYSCCILLLLDVCVNVCGERRDGVRENMFCLCVYMCVCVRESQSCSSLLPWQCWAHGSGSFTAQLCQSRAAGSLFVSVEEKCTHTEEACESDR